MTQRLFITTSEIWARYGKRFAGPRDRVEFVASTARDEVSRRFDRLAAEQVWGVGGGQAIDIAKYIGARCGAWVVAVPTIISTDAFLVADCALREGGRVIYMPAKKPDEVRIEPDIILSAPPHMNSAGWGDVLSIITAVWDWRAAHQDMGEPYDEEIARAALALTQRAVRPDREEGLRALLCALRAEVELCEKWGSARPEEGSEHFFAYTLERHLPRDGKFLHGELVALGIYLMAQWQGQKVAQVTALMDGAGLRWQPQEIGVPPDAVAAALGELAECARRFGYPYSVINRRARRRPSSP